jgi:para-nitrobenzyl esterase
MTDPVLPDRRTVLAGGLALGAAAVASASPVLAREGEGPVAMTRHGPVRGAVEDGVNVFKGVRYGADTAPRRFMPALPPEPWTEVRPALEYGAASPQKSAEPNQSEDCLFLNVWTRGLRDGGKRPVMVYIHGGAHANGSGSSPLYDGVNLCKRGDVVVVTVNHRLNVFGYGYFARVSGAGPELADSGNVGNLDLILALTWVRDNIAEFGGDPDRVMIFGQSGGGGKVVTLLAMPPAAGLFQRAATMSGQHPTVMGPLHATRRAEAFMAQVGVSGIDELRAAPFQRLVAGLNMKDPLVEDDGIIFWSVLDMRSTPRHPVYPDAPAQSKDIPLIVGTVNDETRYFLGSDEANYTLTWDTLPAKLAPEMVADIDPDYVVARYREWYPDYTPSDVFFAASTAGRSWRGSVILAQERARLGAPTWVYQVNFPSPMEGGRRRALHTIDIPLVFDNIHKEGAKAGTGPEAQAMADAMSSAFIAHARAGDPNHQGIPSWPQYTVPRRAEMIWDTPPAVVDDPRGRERELFALTPYVKPGT